MNLILKKLLFLWLIFPTAFPSLHAESIIGAYYENYSQDYPNEGSRPPFSPDMIDKSLLTDLYFAFAYFGYIPKTIDSQNPHLTNDFAIQPTESDDQSKLYPQIQKLKQNSNLKTFLTIGGWNFNNPNDPQGAGQQTYTLFSQMISNIQNRKQFIDSAIAYAHKYGFDGIDIDWEYPGDLTRGGSVEDFKNFLDFVKECSEAFSKINPRLLLAYDAPAHIPAGLPSQYQNETFFKWISQCAEYLDRIQIMAYDYHSPFDNTKLTGVNAPLNRDTNPNSPYFIARTLENYLNNGVPADKILLGLPVFGHSYAGVIGFTPENKGLGLPFTSPGNPGPATKNPGFLAYFEILDMVKKTLLPGIDNITNTAYGYNESSKEWVSYDTPETIKLKVQMAKDKSLKGVIFWSINMDEYWQAPKYPTIRAAHDLLQ